LPLAAKDEKGQKHLEQGGGYEQHARPELLNLVLVLLRKTGNKMATRLGSLACKVTLVWLAKGKGQI
jgi:hypothetical protein